VGSGSVSLGRRCFHPVAVLNSRKQSEEGCQERGNQDQGQSPASGEVLQGAVGAQAAPGSASRPNEDARGQQGVASRNEWSLSSKVAQ